MCLIHTDKHYPLRAHFDKLLQSIISPLHLEPVLPSIVELYISKYFKGFNRGNESMFCCYDQDVSFLTFD